MAQRRESSRTARGALPLWCWLVGCGALGLGLGVPMGAAWRTAAVRGAAATRSAALVEAARQADAGDRRLAEGQLPEAFAAYKEAERIAPADARGAYGQGRVYQQLQQFERAEAAFRRAMAAEHARIAVRLQTDLGIVLGKLGRTDESLALLERAAAAEPENVSIRFALGESLVTAGKPRRAAEVLTQCLGKLGGRREAWLYAHLGRARAALAEADAAEQAYREAIRRDRGFPKAHLWLGQLLQKRGDHAAAAAELAAAERWQQVEERLGALQQARAATPRDLETLVALAAAYLERGWLDEAATTARAARAVAPADQRVRRVTDEIAAARQTSP